MALLYAIGILKARAKWESGKSQPQTAHLVALAEIFGCGVDELLGAGGMTFNDLERKLWRDPLDCEDNEDGDEAMPESESDQ